MFSSILNGQIDKSGKKAKISISAGQNFSGNYKFSDSYQGSIFQSRIDITRSGISRASNYNFGIGYKVDKKFWFNGSIGISNFGFHYTGPVVASEVNLSSVGGFVSSETYNVRLMEVAGIIEYKTKVKDEISLLVQTGLAWYTNDRQKFTKVLQIFQNTDNFSALLFTGIEVPVINENFSVSAGVNIKMALGNFAASYDNEEYFYPYAIGLQSTISYRFWNE